MLYLTLILNYLNGGMMTMQELSGDFIANDSESIEEFDDSDLSPSALEESDDDDESPTEEVLFNTF